MSRGHHESFAPIHRPYFGNLLLRIACWLPDLEGQVADLRLNLDAVRDAQSLFEIRSDGQNPVTAQ